jgi:hypothetical protein
MSTLKVTNIQATGETATRAVSGVAAAWVNFDGTGTIAVRDSVNVSGLVDEGVGQYSVTLISVMSNTSYAAQVTPQHGGYMGGFAITSSTASSVKITSVIDSGTYSDSTVMSCSILGDLA